MSDFFNTTLGDLVQAGGGIIHTGPFGSQLHAADYVAKGIPCIMPANMKNNRVNLSKISFISEEDAQRLSKYIVKKGDIVYSRRGDVTLKALIRDQEVGYFCGTGCLLLRPGNNLDPDFLTYYLSSPRIQNWIVSQAVGATMPNLNTDILARVPFMGPKKETQKKVAKILRAVDDRIELNNRINAELEAMVKTLYNYWFVQFDFPDANGKPYKSSGGEMVYNSSLKRKIPAGWCVCNLGDVLSFKRGISYKSSDIQEDGIPLINLNSFSLSGNFKLDGTKYFNGKYKNEGKLFEQDLVIAITDVTRNADIIGKSFVVPDIFKEQPLMSCDVASVSSEVFGVGYLEQLFNSDYYHDYIKHYASGTLVLHLDLNGIKWFKTYIPPVELLNKFESQCKLLYKQRELTLKENIQLRSLHDWLLPKIISGQLFIK